MVALDSFIPTKTSNQLRSSSKPRTNSFSSKNPHCQFGICTGGWILACLALLKKRGYKFLVQLAGSVMPHIPESRIYYELLQKMTRVSAGLVRRAATVCAFERHIDVQGPGCQRCGPLHSFTVRVSKIRALSAVRLGALHAAERAFRYRPNRGVCCSPDAFQVFRTRRQRVLFQALDQRRPVIVCDSGGPAETVIEDVTGSKVTSLVAADRLRMRSDLPMCSDSEADGGAACRGYDASHQETGLASARLRQDLRETSNSSRRKDRLNWEISQQIFGSKSGEGGGGCPASVPEQTALP